jgi:hypothetical protein
VFRIDFEIGGWPGRLRRYRTDSESQKNRPVEAIK